MLMDSYKFCPIVANEARNLAVGDEDGSVHIVDTKADDSHPAKTITIAAHKNAIFDLCWSKDDKRIVSRHCLITLVDVPRIHR